MKKSDIAMLILIASVSVIGAYFVTKAVLGDPNKESVKVKTAEKITPDIVMPDSQELSGVFNKDAINPTIQVVIGTGKSTDQTDTTGSSGTDTTTDGTSDATQSTDGTTTPENDGAGTSTDGQTSQGQVTNP